MRWTETRECRRLTWPARTLVMAVVLVAMLVGARHVHDFLAPITPINGDYLVVEGWMGDFALTHAAEIFQQSDYQRMLITGAGLYRDAVARKPLSNADVAARILRRLGMADADMVLIGSPKVRRNRTYSTALAVRDWFRDQGIDTPRFDLASEATHSARSHMLYRKAFDGGAEIGVIALPRDDYDPVRWWASSAGIRSVIAELLGWLYVRVFFHP